MFNIWSLTHHMSFQTSITICRTQKKIFQRTLVTEQHWTPPLPLHRYKTINRFLKISSCVIHIKEKYRYGMKWSINYETFGGDYPFCVRYNVLHCANICHIIYIYTNIYNLLFFHLFSLFVSLRKTSKTKLKPNWEVLLSPESSDIFLWVWSFQVTLIWSCRPSSIFRATASVFLVKCDFKRHASSWSGTHLNLKHWPSRWDVPSLMIMQNR